MAGSHPLWIPLLRPPLWLCFGPPALSSVLISRVKNKQEVEFPGGLVMKGSGVVTPVAQVPAMEEVRSLAQELWHVAGKATK